MLKNLSFALLALFSSNLYAEDDSWSNVFKFQTKMAEMGNVRAQFILGEMYEEGRGVQKNRVKAIEWYRKAKSNGNKDAAGRITKIQTGIAQEKASLAKKHIKPKKVKKAPKKTKPNIKKQIVKLKPIPSKTQKQKKIVQSTYVSSKQMPAPKKEIIAKRSKPANIKPRKITSPEDFSRGKGTHLDAIEDPFE